jgi:sulfur carrier protein
MTEQSVAMRRALTVNGSRESLEAATVAELVEAHALNGAGIAVAINGRVIPRVAWPTTPLAEGDTIEIVRAMQGG